MLVLGISGRVFRFMFGVKEIEFFVFITLRGFSKE